MPRPRYRRHSNQKCPTEILANRRRPTCVGGSASELTFRTENPITFPSASSFFQYLIVSGFSKIALLSVEHHFQIITFAVCTETFTCLRPTGQLLTRCLSLTD